MGRAGSGAKALIAGLFPVFLWAGIAAERATADPAVITREGYTLIDLGSMTLVGTGGGNGAINDYGQVIGESYTSGDFAWHAFLYSNGVTTELSLGGSDGWAVAINNRGEVIGRSHTPGDLAIHAFLYSDGQMIELGLGGSRSEATAINDAGEVIGESYTAGDLAWHAFLYRNGTITDLNLGGSHSEAIAISREGEVVGRSLTAGDSAVHAYYYRNGKITDVTRVAHELFQVENFHIYGIRTRQVVGYGYRNGNRHSYFLSMP